MSAHLLASELVSQTVEKNPDRVFISVVSSRSVLPAAHLARRIRERIPRVHICAGVWCRDRNGRRAERVARSKVQVFSNLADATRALEQFVLLRGEHIEAVSSDRTKVP